MMPHALLMDAKKASVTEVPTASGGSSQPPPLPAAPPFRFFGAFGGMALARAGGDLGAKMAPRRLDMNGSPPLHV